MTVVLDAWAILAVLNGEDARHRVLDFTDHQDSVCSWINLGEVIYQRMRRTGASTADVLLGEIASTVHAEEPDAELVVAAAEIKARGGVSYADAFAAATAIRHRAPLLTGDPELVALDLPGLEVVDVRA